MTSRRDITAQITNPIYFTLFVLCKNKAQLSDRRVLQQLLQLKDQKPTEIFQEFCWHDRAIFSDYLRLHPDNNVITILSNTRVHCLRKIGAITVILK